MLIYTLGSGATSYLRAQPAVSGRSWPLRRRERFCVWLAAASVTSRRATLSRHANRAPV